MATRPLVLPDAYSGEGNQSQWYFHFQSMVAVDEWNKETQLKWLKVRLMGRAQTAFQRLPPATQANFAETIAALKERFKPASQKTRYQAELQTRRKKKTENWADLAEDLRVLADKAYPELENNARETGTDPEHLEGGWLDIQGIIIISNLQWLDILTPP